MPRKLRWSRHRKDGVLRKLVAQQGGPGTRKEGVPRALLAQ